MGFVKVEMGSNVLGIESEVSWATPGTFTIHNKACAEDGANCGAQGTHFYEDPSVSLKFDRNVLKTERKLRKNQ